MSYHEIELIKKNEEEALEDIRYAEKEAEEILKKAKARGLEIIEEKRKSAEEEAENLALYTLEKAGRKRSEIMLKAEKTAKELRESGTQKYESAVEYIINLATGAENADPRENVQADFNSP
ncbi:vacuolar-type H+-ATPase subunit H [Methanomicrobium sp. W14]|uniref:hypothetical protein n=1 Tax=Methanomicrobium sp. W14 TaxID=2817839 RepID=UPI001AE35C72|nr:hypothetical protein [Methanomicrobium sp. W14]MBP2133330.1 vacuolar-type H+-ATPase subunit H [Methanomicrobium sp. W14]